MTPAERDQFNIESMRPHVAAAIIEGFITLGEGETLDSVMNEIRFIRGVPSGARAAAPVMMPARCILCSCEFKSVDEHPVCWPCRADARGDA